VLRVDLFELDSDLLFGLGVDGLPDFSEGA